MFYVIICVKGNQCENTPLFHSLFTFFKVAITQEARELIDKVQNLTKVIGTITKLWFNQGQWMPTFLAGIMLYYWIFSIWSTLIKYLTKQRCHQLSVLVYDRRYSIQSFIALITIKHLFRICDLTIHTWCFTAVWNLDYYLGLNFRSLQGRSILLFSWAYVDCYGPS